MYVSVLVGFLVGFGSLIFSALLENNFHFGELLGFFNLPALIIIWGGVAGAIIISFPPDHLSEVLVALRKVFMPTQDLTVASLAQEMLEISQKSRQGGILSIEEDIQAIKDPWLKLGLQFVVDGLDQEFIVSMMDLKLAEFEEKTRRGAKVFHAMGGFAPTLGIIGTVMGLVHMLANLSDSANVGASIAVAFLATFWGILTANLIFLPIAGRTKIADDKLIAVRQAMIEGILSIQSGEPVRVLEERLKVFMSQDELERFTHEKLTSEKARNE